MRTITKFRRNAKALSPIFATLILIAIAVIAGIVVYMFTSGMLASLTGGGGSGQEKMAIQAVAGNTTGTAATDIGISVWAQSTAGGDIALDTAIIKNSAGSVLATVDMGTQSVGTSLTKVFVQTDVLSAGQSYTVTLITVAGNNFPSTSFKAD